MRNPRRDTGAIYELEEGEVRDEKVLEEVAQRKRERELQQDRDRQGSMAADHRDRGEADNGEPGAKRPHAAVKARTNTGKHWKVQQIVTRDEMI